MNKDENVVEREGKKKFFNKKVILLILLVIISLVGVFFISTYIRWKAEISELKEIIYYGQDTIEISELKDFYGDNLAIDLDDYHAMKLYCTSEYGNKCITGDYVNFLENLFRNPRIVINIIILIDLVIIYLLIKDRKLKNVLVYVVSLLILGYGIYSLGFQIFKLADYIGHVNDSENVVQAKIVRGVITNSNNHFKPIVEYSILDETYLIYLDYSIKGNIMDKKDETITIYYDEKDPLNVEVKRSLWSYVLSTIISILTIVISIGYYRLKNINKEKKEERS